MKVDNESNKILDSEHQQLGIPPVKEAVTHLGNHPILTIATWFTSLVLVSLLLYCFTRLFLPNNWHGGLHTILDTLQTRLFWSAVFIGLFAQMIDGALGMAYGVTATTFLMGAGISPALASASVHTAEIFTSGLSGILHAKLGNVNKHIFLSLLIPGILGEILGSLLVTQFEGNLIKGVVSAYLLCMGLYILSKAYRRFKPTNHPPKHLRKLALLGGFLDAAGGGGWGPVVTTTLVGAGNDPRTTIGSVNFAEFFLTLASSISFFILLGESPWVLVSGLILGGLFAAPFAALLCKHLHAKTLLILVGGLITLLSFYNLYRVFFRS